MGYSVTGIGNEDTELNITWVPSNDAGCINVTYTVQLHTCPPDDSPDMPVNCTITTATTAAHIKSSDCLNLTFGQSLFFRVKADVCRLDDVKCYKSYFYIPSLMDTGVCLVIFFC